MPFFAGFDCCAYPGDPAMDWLKANTNFSWCGFYLAPAPSHSEDTSWMDRQSYLSGSGWGLLPIYVGQQTAGPGSHIVTAAQGTLDGKDAASLAGNAGFGAGSYVYLDIEQGPPLTNPMSDYILNWGAALVQQGYRPGFYCSHAIAKDVAQFTANIWSDIPPRIWAFSVPTTTAHDYTGNASAFRVQDPCGCGFATALAWQYAQNARVKFAAAPFAALCLDLSVATLSDPGAPDAA